MREREDEGESSDSRLIFRQTIGRRRGFEKQVNLMFILQKLRMDHWVLRLVQTGYRSHWIQDMDVLLGEKSSDDDDPLIHD
jgi:hypothetical protein